MNRTLPLSLLILLTGVACDSQPLVNTPDDKEKVGDDSVKANGRDSGLLPDGGKRANGSDPSNQDFIDPNQGGDAGTGCVPESCEDRGFDCGQFVNNCGKGADCGACDEDSLCGGETPNVCVQLSELESTCTKAESDKACEDKQCGLVGDGCGGSINCGSCEDDEGCGIVELFQCDALATALDGGISASCQPQSAEQACDGKECGKVFDGCGSADENTFDCSELQGGCEANEYCGLAAPFQCGELPSVNCEAAESCAELGWACGTAMDECGNTFDCEEEGRSCVAMSEVCVGGVDGPTQCIGGNGEPSFLNCDVCDAIPTCEGDDTTRLTGRVITPGRSAGDTGNQVGVPNAFVYILRNNNDGELPNIETGIPEGGTRCERCADEDLGPVLSSGTTNSLGEYVLDGNIPVGKEFLLVVKIGKFRRAVAMTLDADSACTDTAVEPQETRLPRSSDDGLGAHLPHIAISTGQIDAMECVFSKMGIDDDEFSQPGDDAVSTSRVHMYRADGASMSDGSTPDAQLHSDAARLFNYDMVVFDCEGPGYSNHNGSDENVRQYVNSGGRMFASHLSYTWIYDNGEQAYDAGDAVNTGLAPSADFPGGVTDGNQSEEGIISTDRPRGNQEKLESFSEWLVNENVATFDEDSEHYLFDIIDSRDLASEVHEYSEEFVYLVNSNDESWVQQYSFNTPYGAPEDAICGRVAYSAFHVSSGGSNSAFADVTFPEHCSGALTNQEKVLLYMLFDLGACVTTEVVDPPTCEPVADCTGRCGVLPDGCGGTLDCTCPEGDLCLAGGICGSTTCQPASCEDQDAECGVVADGCGEVANCGPCDPGEVCGLQAPNQCGKPPACTPLECAAQDAECGVIGDGCGGQVDCGPCDPGEICGLETAYQCDKPDCPALTCEDENAECGLIGDGCGGLVECGDCPPGFICGLRSPNICDPEPGGAH